MIFALRFSLLCVWLIITSLAGLVLALTRWGDVDLNGVFSRMFHWGATRITGVQVVLEGREHLDVNRPCIYVANHQGAMDLLLFGGFYPKRTVVIGKREIVWIPIFGPMFMAFGNIRIDRDRRVQAIAGLNEAVQAIRERQLSLWIFPEGTRNRTTEAMLPFKKGAFHMARQAGVPIVPVVAGALDALVSWSERRLKSGRICVRVLPPMMPGDFPDVETFLEETQRRMIGAIPSPVLSSVKT